MAYIWHGWSNLGINLPATCQLMSTVQKWMTPEAGNRARKPLESGDRVRNWKLNTVRKLEWHSQETERIQMLEGS